MTICYTLMELRSAIDNLKNANKKVGFVPTMGALHQGHLALIKQSAAENEITVCSIFVNPIQFNNPEDLQKYPRTPEKDIRLIENYCHVLFMPSVEEMYPAEVIEKYNFGTLETVMEGAFRPGHFNGVAVVVNRLFTMVRPDRAYFGEKDYQQLQIIKAMTKQLQLAVEVVSCPIVREEDGLAMSSRNTRLTEDNRKLAPFIYKTLNLGLIKVNEFPLDKVIELIKTEFQNYPSFKIEYIEIADESTLQPIRVLNLTQKARIFVAVWLGDIRLIDNLLLN